MNLVSRVGQPPQHSQIKLNFFGGEVLADFALAMIWGVCIGTYSSIFIAVPILLYVKLKRGEGDYSGLQVPEDER